MKERQKLISWDDPAPGVAAMPGMSGLEYMHSMMGKKLPPAHGPTTEYDVGPCCAGNSHLHLRSG